jgi:hypothetical protein
VNTVDVLAASAAVLCPVVVSVAVIAAALTWPPPAHADPVGDSITTVLNSVGIGNNGPLSTASAQVGQSICPMLVQLGSNFASNATRVSGNGGLAPPIAGFVTGMAIQSQCPALMTAIANGNWPFPLTGAMPSPAPFSLRHPSRCSYPGSIRRRRARFSCPASEHGFGGRPNEPTTR